MSRQTPAELPRTYDEAVARGFTPVTDIGEAVKRITGLTLSEFKARKKHQQHDFVAQVDCLHDPDGTPCDSDCSEGHCIIFYCRGGACSHTEALEGDL